MASADAPARPGTDRRSGFRQPVTTSIGFPGTGISASETEPPNHCRRVTETAHPQIKMRKSPPIAGLCRQSPKTREITDWVVADVVRYEPVSLLFGLNRVISGKKQGDV